VNFALYTSCMHRSVEGVSGPHPDSFPPMFSGIWGHVSPPVHEEGEEEAGERERERDRSGHDFPLLSEPTGEGKDSPSL
jgi:hypothetical protein